MEQKRDAITRIYDAFEKEAAAFRENAVCGKGCAFCCTDAGSIHITTLEGLTIRDRVGRLSRPRRIAVQKALARDMKKREKTLPSACPFLMKNRTCMVYDIRPFACRRVYSVRTCTKDAPPMLNRRVIEMADHAIRKLQELDETGYSGHISYILYMLEQPGFRATYLAGECKPEEVAVFGKTHGVLINRMVVS